MTDEPVTPDQELLDEKLIESLVQFDEALRAGRVPPNPVSEMTDGAYVDLTTAVNCLLELEGAYPRSRGHRQHSDSPGVPRRVGRFEIEGFLGSGGFASVYKAKDHLLNRTVAIKIPRPHARASPDLRRRFVREAQAAAQLDHPHIVPIYDAGEDRELPYIAYAYCEGPTLATWVKETELPIPPQQAARLMLQLADAVQYCHERKILHRDIKPANVLLFPQSIPSDRTFPFVLRLSDLGLAKLVETSLEETTAEMVLGTPLYMSPEQAEGRNAEVGPASDIYSLGAVLYFLLCGRPPFLAAGLMEALVQVIDREPIAPRELNPAVDIELNTICLKCLEKVPSRRYASAQELADDLARYMAGEPIHARPATWTFRASQWCRRKPAIAGLLAGIAFLACGLVGALAWNAFSSAAHQRNLLDRNDLLQDTVQRLDDALQTTDEQRRIAETNEGRVLQLLYVADLQLAAAALKQQDPRSVVALLGRHASSPQDRVNREFGWRYLRSKVTAPSRLIANTQQKIWYATFSPNGRWLAVCGDQGFVQLFDAATEFSLVHTFETNQREVNSVCFTPDSQLLASAGDDGRVGIWNVSSGEHRRWLEVLPNLPIFGVAFLDEGKQLVACGKSPELSLWDVATGEQVIAWATPHSRTIEALALSPDGQRIATAGTEGVAYIFRLGQSKPELELRGHIGPVTVVGFSPEGQCLITGGADGTVRSHDAGRGNLIELFRRLEPIAALAVTSGGYIAVSDRGGVITILDLPEPPSGGPTTSDSSPSWQARRIWAGHDDRVHGLALSPDGNNVISGNSVGDVRNWPLGQVGSNRRISPTADNLFPRPNAICCGAEPNSLFRVGSSGIEVWDAGLNQPQATLVRDRSLYSCSYVAAQRMLVVGDSAGRVGLMQRDQPNDTNWFDVFSDSFIICATVYDEGKQIVALSGGDELAVLDVASGNVVARLPNRSSFAVSPDARWLATARHGTNDLSVLEAGTLQEVARLAGHQRPIRQIRFSRDGKKMLTASDDRTAIVWDTNSWTPTYSLLGNNGGISSVAISPDGETIVTGEKNGTIGLWYASSGQKLFELAQLEHDVMSLEFAANGDELFALASDMSVHVFPAPSIASPESATGSAAHFPSGERH